MAEYNVQTPDGASYHISADSDDKAQEAISDLLSKTTKSGPEWSDLPGNAVEGLKEAPQNAVGLAKMAKMGSDLTSPISWAQSAGQAMTGTPMGETPVGEAVNTVKEGVGHTIDTLKGIPEVMQHPLESAKKELIEHPISSAINVATLPLAGGMGEEAAETAAKYAGRFGENQMGHVHGTTPAQFAKLKTNGTFGDAMRESFANGDANPLQGSIGRREAIDQRVHDLGQDIGSLREQAAADGPSLTPEQMAKALQDRLGSSYAPGGENYKQANQFESEIQNIKSMPQGSIPDYAQRASAIKSDAVKNQMILPDTVGVDVANQMSHINDENIAKNLPPQVNEAYTDLKNKFGNAKALQPMEIAGEKKEFRSNHSDSIVGMLKKAGTTMMGGPKLGAQAGFGAEKALTDVAKNGQAYGMAGVTSNIMSRIQNNPQSLGKFATPLMQAAQSGGQQGVAATHYILSNQYPEYNQMMQDDAK